MDTKVLIYAIFGTFGAIAVAYGAIFTLYRWVSAHISERKKHPCADDIVYKDVCTEKHKGFEECVEGEILNLTKNFDDFKETTKDNFDEVKRLIRQRNGLRG